MTTPTAPRLRRRIGYAACAWAVLFAAPHAWWAAGFPHGFPGGEASYRVFMSSTWRYAYNLAVVGLCALAVVIVLMLLWPPQSAARRTVLRAAAWTGSGALTLRGAAGIVVDGASDPVWWPTFLLGGILLGTVAWLARRDAAARDASQRR